MRKSQASAPNDLVKPLDSFEDQDNFPFFQEAIEQLLESDETISSSMMIGLVGQRDLPGHRLRTAQSVLRWDLRPSLWSHAFLIDESVDPDESDLRDAEILEVPFYSLSGQFPRPEQNAVMRNQLGVYDDASLHANVALLAVPMEEDQREQVEQRAHEFNYDRTRYNFWDTLGTWQGYFWSHGKQTNPLEQNTPMFNAQYIEMVYDAVNLSLTPAASERNVAPEYIWNGARWWHKELSEFGFEVHGRYVLRDRGCEVHDA